jgi:formylglycine-generating enzyme required for sulfatase activity
MINNKIFTCFCICIILIWPAKISLARQNHIYAGKSDPFTNSIGIQMMPIRQGTFKMGLLNPTDPSLGGPNLLKNGDYDETPAHNVTITKPFYMSAEGITVEQFKKFQTGYQQQGTYVKNVSWYEAVGFCEWLSEKEQKPYRLPTEAEWEYACRAGSTTLFNTGNTRPDNSKPNAWGLKGMHTSKPQWCLDWHGLYSYKPQVDPVGPDWGFVKVVRGGHMFTSAGQGVDPDAPYYFRSANRGGMAPSERLAGFRIVQAPIPFAKPIPYEAPFINQCIVNNTDVAQYGIAEDVPYFRSRTILPIPPENVELEMIEAAGLPKGHLGHNHSSALVAFDNGDLLAVYWNSSTSSKEYWPNVAFSASRLRFGSTQWDMPEIILDIPDVREGGSFLWNDNGTVHLFTGGVGLDGVPFKWCSTTDFGKTWSQLKFPDIKGPVGPFMGQPNGNGFRDLQGNIFAPTDGVGPHSVLWLSKDNGKTWYDTGGRTGGRHTAFVLLKDGGILGMGGKKSDIDGYMPKSISYDMGKTWQLSKTPFPALGSNQRPTIVRLKSGRLFFATDLQEKSKGRQPEGINDHGCVAALSDDDGVTWKMKKIPNTLPHESRTFSLEKQKHWAYAGHDYPTLGYCIAAQAKNSVIHLITSMNHPNQHFEMSEAWILSDLHDQSPEPKGEVRNFQQKYPDGTVMANWSAKISNDGRYLLHGKQTWYFKNGQKRWQLTYRNGKKVKTETVWNKDGQKKWQWKHKADGSAAWKQWWDNGNNKAESNWQDSMCQGLARTWDPQGEIVTEVFFIDGQVTTRIK